MALELFEYAVSLGNDDAMFSAGLIHAQMPGGDPLTALVWGLLSERYCPQGQGRALVERMSARLTPEDIAEAQRRAAAWKRADKTMAWHVTTTS